LLNLRGLTSKNDTIHTNIQVNGWTKIGVNIGLCLGKISMIILSYTGLPQVKISQKVLGGYFFDSHSMCVYCTACASNTFQCVSNGMCIPTCQLCDGYSQCGDYSDESDCTHINSKS